MTDPAEVSPYRVFVSELGLLSEKDLSNYFSRFGIVENVRILKSKKGVTLGKGFISFNDAESMNKALEHEEPVVANVRISVERVYDKKAAQAQAQAIAQEVALPPVDVAPAPAEIPESEMAAFQLQMIQAAMWSIPSRDNFPDLSVTDTGRGPTFGVVRAPKPKAAVPSQKKFPQVQDTMALRLAEERRKAEEEGDPERAALLQAEKEQEAEEARRAAMREAFFAQERARLAQEKARQDSEMAEAAKTTKEKMEEAMRSVAAVVATKQAEVPAPEPEPSSEPDQPEAEASSEPKGRVILVGGEPKVIKPFVKHPTPSSPEPKEEGRAIIVGGVPKIIKPFTKAQSPAVVKRSVEAPAVPEREIKKIKGTFQGKGGKA